MDTVIVVARISHTLFRVCFISSSNLMQTRLLGGGGGGGRHHLASIAVVLLVRRWGLECGGQRQDQTAWRFYRLMVSRDKKEGKASAASVM